MHLESQEEVSHIAEAKIEAIRTRARRRMVVTFLKRAFFGAIFLALLVFMLPVPEWLKFILVGGLVSLIVSPLLGRLLKDIGQSELLCPNCGALAQLADISLEYQSDRKVEEIWQTYLHRRVQCRRCKRHWQIILPVEERDLLWRH
ncbi:MAG TPA: hypothetical protein VJK26_02925 [Patescibacteria group bacterium]|nr:hypothetical protein [Patescibacteria group bacterium]